MTKKINVTSKKGMPLVNKNIMRGLGILIIILIIVVVLQAGKNKINLSPGVRLYPTPTQNSALLSTTNKGNGFKEYISNEYGFSLEIPENYSIEKRNVTRSNISPIETEINIKDEYGNITVYLSMVAYNEGENFYDLIEALKKDTEYEEPNETRINNTKGIMSRRKAMDGFTSLLYLVPIDDDSYIRMSYSAPKNDMGINLPNLAQEKIIRSFKFI